MHASNGGLALCKICGAENSPIRNLWECKRWASHPPLAKQYMQQADAYPEDCIWRKGLMPSKYTAVKEVRGGCAVTGQWPSDQTSSLRYG